MYTCVYYSSTRVPVWAFLRSNLITHKTKLKVQMPMPMQSQQQMQMQMLPTRVAVRYYPVASSRGHIAILNSNANANPAMPIQQKHHTGPIHQPNWTLEIVLFFPVIVLLKSRVNLGFSFQIHKIYLKSSEIKL